MPSKKSSAKETYMEVTELSKQLHNLKVRNPEGKNVAVLQARIDKKSAALTEDQISAIQGWSDAIPE